MRTKSSSFCNVHVTSYARDNQMDREVILQSLLAHDFERDARCYSTIFLCSIKILKVQILSGC